MCTVQAYCGTTFYTKLGEKRLRGKIPPDMGIGSDLDGVFFEYCFDCGQIKGDWPLETTRLERGNPKTEEFP